jgi:hypothetical protein
MYWGPGSDGITPYPDHPDFVHYDVCSPTGNLVDDPLYPIFRWLMGEPGHENVNNIFGSLPSFHNF